MSYLFFPASLLRPTALFSGFFVCVICVICGCIYLTVAASRSSGEKCNKVVS
jgi:hypothetical protein